ncbi:MAG: hypothetical protein R3B82_19265 [Sandaracinaceae bacterium]
MSSFVNLIDLAAEALGGRALACTDDFFASMDNLVKPGRGIFEPDGYTDRGKWMDGWESRRKRVPGHDWCASSRSARRASSAPSTSTPTTSSATTRLSRRSRRRTSRTAPPSTAPSGSSSSPRACGPGRRTSSRSTRTGHTHVRLHIYRTAASRGSRSPGRVRPTFEPPALDDATAPHVTGGEVDLAAVINGGKALACSDAFFGPMDNLLLPARATYMGSGWEDAASAPRPGTTGSSCIRLGAPGTSRSSSSTPTTSRHFPDSAAGPQDPRPAR